jgi:hypothetical protein
VLLDPVLLDPVLLDPVLDVSPIASVLPQDPSWTLSRGA